jgi:hypothetical protein
VLDKKKPGDAGLFFTAIFGNFCLMQNSPRDYSISKVTPALVGKRLSNASPIALAGVQKPPSTGRSS